MGLGPKIEGPFSGQLRAANREGPMPSPTILTKESRRPVPDGDVDSNSRDCAIVSFYLR